MLLQVPLHNKCNLLSKIQSRFCKGCSCETAFLNGNIICSLIVLYFMLLAMLYFFGIRNDSLRTFSSFSTDKMQIVKVRICLSGPAKITCGVPQGSVLCLLFLTFYLSVFASTVQHDEFYFYIL